MKNTHWDAHNNPDGTINLGYFAQDPEGNYHAVDFDFNTLTWGTIYKWNNGKYRLTIPAPIELGLCIVDEEQVPRSDWGEIDRSRNTSNTPDEQSDEEEQPSSFFFRFHFRAPKSTELHVAHPPVILLRLLLPSIVKPPP